VIVPLSDFLLNILRSFRRLQNAPLAWAWAGLILAIHGAVALAGGPHQPPALSWYVTLGLSREGIFVGKLWQVFTHGFLHGGWLHAGMNAVFVLLIGARIEHVVGRRILMQALIFGIGGGGLGHLLLAPGEASSGLLVGLSGGGTALLLLLATLSPQSRMLPLPISAKSLGIGVLIAELVLALIDPRLRIPGVASVGRGLAELGLSSWFQVGHACHFGGGIAGWMLGRWILRSRITLKHLRRDRERREASGSGGIG
jgi:membrane associated rhomboid family serine protease